jgi:hypothetical protein
MKAYVHNVQVKAPSPVLRVLGRALEERAPLNATWDDGLLRRERNEARRYNARAAEMARHIAALQDLLNECDLRLAAIEVEARP